jgi:hypothetical protein
LQSAFNEISLERNPKLWQSSDDGRTEARIRFLSEFPETLFPEQLGRERRHVGKNAALSAAFKEKGAVEQLQLASTN